MTTNRIETAIIERAERHNGIIGGGQRVEIVINSKKTPNVLIRKYYTVNQQMRKLVEKGLFIETLTNIRHRDGREWRLA